MSPLIVAIAAANPFDNERALQEWVDAEVSGIATRRGLAARGSVPARLSDPSDLRAHIEGRLAEDMNPSELAGTSATFVTLGLAPPGLDLYATFREVLVEQIEGFYDPIEGALFLVRREQGDPALDPVVVEHELVHALQDQVFGLRALDEADLDDSDVTLALRSLVEGDATLFNVVTLAGDFLDVTTLPLRPTSPPGADAPDSALARAPRLVGTQLLFPYTDGAALCQHLYALGGFNRIDAAFREAQPLSSEQVLHPERFTSHPPDWPLTIDLPPVAPRTGGVEVDEDTLGELGVRVWLTDVGEVSVPSDPIGWAGDRYVTVLDDAGRASLVWVLAWDDVDAALAFEAQARRTIGHQLRHPHWRRDGTTKGAGRAAAVVRDGVDVIVTYAPTRAEAASLVDVGRDAPRSPRTSVDVFRR